jgi:cyclic beta-1,2-glucan synthetase
MFEYLMPALVMQSPSGSMLQQTCRLVVQRQVSYGAEHGVPWGISESAYNVRDLDLTYQYSSFGVPGLGLERGLGEDLVVAPYATALAAMVDPVAATQNLSRLAEAGARGAYGFYEALDYTRSRLPKGTPVVIVRAYTAHHQAMTLIALVNVLRGGVMRDSTRNRSSRLRSYSSRSVRPGMSRSRGPASRKSRHRLTAATSRRRDSGNTPRRTT